MADFTASVMVIEELGGLKRKLELNGAGLPFRGASWTSTTMVKTRWYPGNDEEATQQVLGSREMPSDWSGRWSRTMLGRSACTYSEGGGTGDPVYSPIFLREAFDTIRRSAQRLRVTWSCRQSTGSSEGKTQSVVREGRLTSFMFEAGYADDVAWQATFEWVGRGAKAQRVVATRDGNVSGELQSLRDQLSDTVKKIDGPTFNAVTRTFPEQTDSLDMGDLEKLANAPGELMENLSRELQQIESQLGEFGDLLNTIRNIPSSLAKQAVDFCANAVAKCNQFVDEMSRRSPETNSTEMSLSGLLQTMRQFGDPQTDCQEIIERAKSIQKRIEPLVIGNPSGIENGDVNRTTISHDIQGVCVTREGDTLPGLSVRFYKSSGHAVDIAKANGLPWYQVQLEPGLTLIIPVLKNTGGIGG